MRNRIRMTCAAALLAMVLCAAAYAADGAVRIVLKEAAQVSGDVIELGDIAELGEGAPPEAAHLVLGNSPWPGYARKLSRVLVKVRLVSAGLDLNRFEFQGAEACLVELKCRRIEPEQVAAAARRCLAAQFPPDEPSATVELLGEVSPVLVPDGEGVVELRPSLSAAAAPAGTVRVDVDIMRGGTLLRSVPLAFTVKWHGTKEQVAAPEDRRGQAVARRPVGLPNRAYVVDANQQVFLVVQTKTLRAVSVGKSLNRARRGEVARAKNLSTGREVVGVAVDSSTIQVFLEGQTDAE